VPDQGVSYGPFTEQLTEVRSAWETLKSFNWPEAWENEKATLECAFDGWSLAKEIWEQNLHGDKLEQWDFLRNAGRIYGSRLEQYARIVALRTKDEGPQQRLNSVLVKLHDNASVKHMVPDSAIEWCLSTATFSFKNALEGIKSKLRE
jgi:hypothetical protein